MRILSLLPGATEIVAALGASRDLVGISHECDFPPEATRLPRVTASAVDRDASSAAIDASVRELSASGRPVFAIDADVVRRLAPDVIITQSLCDVCAVSEGDVRDIATLVHPAPRLVPMTGTTLDGVWADVRAIGEAIGRAPQADALLAGLTARIRGVHETLKAARAPRPRVAVIEWLDPLFAAGHWTPELVRRAGGIDVLAEPGAHSVTLSLEVIRAAKPDVVVFAPCGFDVERAAREATVLLARDEWAWARELDAWAIDGNALTSRPGPRLADAIETLAEIFAPRCFGDPAADYARRIAGRN